MASGFGNLSGPGPHQVYVNVWYDSYSQAGNYSTWGYDVRYYGNGSGTWINGNLYWSISGFVSSSGSFQIPYAERNNTYKALAGGYFTKGHDANGYLAAGNTTAVIDGSVHTSIGSGSVTVTSGTPPRIPKVPAAPTLFGVDQATTTSLRYQFNGGDNGGSTILEWQAQASTDPTFAVVDQTVVSNGTTTFTGLSPGNEHHFRARGRNAVGWGAWGAAGSGLTLPATPPIFSILPTIAGTAANLTLAPPSGVASVDSYTVERRLVGGAATSIPMTGSGTISGLTPGAIYEWRAQAHIGTYATPWTDWIVQAQPNPNTSPGDYFDGATAPRGDLTFAWLAAANNSMSIAQGVAPEGWTLYTTTSGATAILQRVTGGYIGTNGARVMIVADATAAGLEVGQPTTHDSEVAEGGTYVASMWVFLDRPQRLAMKMNWRTEAGVAVGGAAIGPDVLVPAGSWQRVTGTFIAPPTAERGRLRLHDVAGAGHSLWLAGESFLVDAAMLTISELFPYFDGNTPPNAQYAYLWLGAENASESMRVTLDLSDFDPLADPDCPPPPAAPQPPAIVDDCIDTVGVWRRYWAVIPEAEVSDWLAVVPTITITTGSLAARQVRVRAYPNPDGVNPDAVESSSWESEQIVSYIPPNAVITLDGVAQRVWADVAGQHVSADRLLYGSGGGPASWPVLSCGTGYLLAFDVPIDAPDGNVAIDVALTTRTM